MRSVEKHWELRRKLGSSRPICQAQLQLILAASSSPLTIRQFHEQLEEAWRVTRGGTVVALVL